MKKFIKRVIITALVVCMSAMMFIFPVACSDDNGNTEAGKNDTNTKPEDNKPTVPEDGGKAIIILPGIMGSNIIDDATGNPLWAPIVKESDDNCIRLKELNGIQDYMKILDQQSIQDLLEFDKKPGGAYEWLDKMKVVINEDGSATSPNKNSAQVIDDNGVVKYPKCSTYGTLEYYEKTFNYLKENFGNEYDVRMFEYDWRLNNMDAAIALENFINSHNYSSVVLVAHSMGGVLASTYIARSEANQKKVDKFISLGTPFFGSHKAIRVICDPLSMIEGDTMTKLIDGVKGAINTKNGEGAFDIFMDRMMDFVRNLPTIYQLMPYADMMGAYNNDLYPTLKGENIMKIGKECIANYDEFLAFLKSQGFNETAINNMIKWQDEQYVMKDGKKIHASMAVDTVYFVGTDLDTELCANFRKKKGEDGKIYDAFHDSTMSKLGDGTVPSYSASCGLNMDDPRIQPCKGISHGDLNDDDFCLEQMKKVIKHEWKRVD